MQKFIVRNVDKLSLINYSDVLYCSADGAYCNIHLLNGETIQLSKTLAKVSTMLELPYIVRISQSILINLHHLKYIIYKDKRIVLTNGEELRFTVPIKILEEWVLKTCTDLEPRLVPKEYKWGSVK